MNDHENAAHVDGYACMMCSLPAVDADETEWRYDTVDGAQISRGEIGTAERAGRAFVVFWVYCRSCDCWTEHPIGLAEPVSRT